MNAETKKGSGLAWPICTMLIIGALGSLVYYGYTQFQAEQAMIAARRSAIASSSQAAPVGAASKAPGAVSPPPPGAASSQTAPPGAASSQTAPPGAASGQTAPPGAYRGGIPFYFIAAFGAVMTTILGGILYLWWSLKDWEGGKRYGDEEPPGEGDQAGR